MTVHHEDPWLTIHGGDCRDVLATLPAESVHCVVTSPPYWGLRDYGTASWEGGDAACDHVAQRKPPTVGSSSTLGYPSDGGQRRIAEGNTYHEAYTAQYRDRCGKCGATRIDRQLGLEQTPDEYVANMVAVFREVRRVLRSDGTCWLNLGDSYASTGPGSWGSSDKSTLTTGSRRGAWAPGQTVGKTPSRDLSGLKPKDLVGIPWRVAFALQADGWYLRSDIIWAKPNPMPESVADRPTKAHEYLFLLTKAGRYWYDADAVREGADPASAKRYESPFFVGPKHESGGYSAEGAKHTPGMKQFDGQRNRRSVWTVATQPYPGAHFAVMPEALVEPCVLAGCPEGGTVLDPFGGSGTVARVANRLSRRAVLIDLNPDYLEQQMERNRDLPLGLTAA